MNVKPTPIAAAVTLALLSAVMSAHAQQAESASKEAKIETVTVTGIRGSLQQSLNQKRAQDTRVEVITAEDIGKMPDKNVADSLQRVPGVNISSAGASEGGFDENDRVSMRGTNPSLTQTLINGHSVSSGDWFVLNQTGTVGRSVSYSLLPSQLVDKVVVNKSSEAALVEGGVAGSINIITRKPLDFKKPLTAEIALGAVYSDLARKTDPQISGLVNWKNDQNSVGVMVQVFSESRHLRRDGQEVLGYQQIKAGSAIATSNPDLANVWYPSLIGSALFEQKRERQGGLIDVQVKPSSSLTLDLSAFSSDMKASNYNRNYMFWGARVLAEGAGQAPAAGYTVSTDAKGNKTLTNAVFAPTAGVQYGIYDQISRPDSGSSSNFLNLDTKWVASEQLTLKTKIGVSKGTGKTPTQDVAEWDTNVGGGASYALNGSNRAADWAVGGGTNSLASVKGLDWIFGFQNVNVKDDGKWAQADGEWTTDGGMFTGLKFGARVAEHERSNYGTVAQGPGCLDASGKIVGFDWSQQYWCPAGTKSPADPANWPQGFQNYPGNFGSGLGGTFPRDIWYFTPEQLAAYNKMTNRDPVTRAYFPADYGVEERNIATYVQGGFEGAGWSGNVGVRLVQAKQRSINNVNVSAADPDAITTSAFGAYKRVAVDHTYNDVLPSANVKFDLAKNLVSRLALSKTITRPDYSALAGAVSLSPPAVAGGVGSGSGGNPDLEPIRSTNFDATLEYYFAPRALLGASFFYMDLQNYVGLGRKTATYKTIDQNCPQGCDVSYDLTVPVNSRGKVKGIELMYEQPLTANIGVAANYTFTDAAEQGGGDLVGASRHSYNLSGYYENDSFSARVNYTFRGKFFSGLDRATAFYQDDVENVSASLQYKFSEQISVSLDAMNLNNPKLKYYALSEQQPRSIYQNGRQYYLNARIKF